MRSVVAASLLLCSAACSPRLLPAEGPPPPPDPAPAHDGGPAPSPPAAVGDLPSPPSTQPVAHPVPAVGSPAPAGPTVEQLIGDAGCSTHVLDGLSRQILEEAACSGDNPWVRVPAEPNLTFGPAVYPYLIEPARDALVATLRAHPDRTMQLNSMARTVAQQFLLYEWAEQGRCNIAVAAWPGRSNHETGLAFDTSDFAGWRPALEAAGFRWLGPGDPVHFEYVVDPPLEKGADVRAFQRLYNRNHPEDTLEVDGDFGGDTEERLRRAPAGGYPIGPSCSASPGSRVSSET